MGITHAPVQAEGWLARNQLCREGPEVPVDTKLNMSQRYALAAKKADSILGCISRGVTNWLRELILPLCSAVPTAHLECCILFGIPQYKKKQTDIYIGESSRRPPRGLGDWSTWHRRKCWGNWDCPVLRREE